MSEGPRVLCPTCREAVDVNDPATVQAFEQVNTATWGEPTDTSDGMKAAFHPGCWIASNPRYRRPD